MKRFRKWTLVSLAVLVAVYFGRGIVDGVLPADPITLTPEIQQRLIDASPIRGDGITREAFNGKPVLVTFFASW